MKHKETAIETLESVVHWMRISSFDYDVKDLTRTFNEVTQSYKKYLDEK